MGKYRFRAGLNEAWPIKQTKAKQERPGSRDDDDYSLVLPPKNFKSALPQFTHCLRGAFGAVRNMTSERLYGILRALKGK